MSQKIIRNLRCGLYAFYVVVVIVLVYYWYQIVYLKNFTQDVVIAGGFSGNLAAVFFILTLLPGMFGRYGISSSALLYVRQVRGNLGVAMFLLATLHYMSVKIFPMLLISTFIPFKLFEVFGFLALQITFVLALTSNRFSIRRMGKWWKRLHSLSYILVWLLFGHVILQGWSLMAMALGLVALLEVGSFGYRRWGGGR